MATFPDLPEANTFGRPRAGDGSGISAADIRPAELARRMDVDQPSINRLLDPRHASRPEQFDRAFATLGKRVVLSLENAA